jgi:hypothetical protein
VTDPWREPGTFEGHDGVRLALVSALGFTGLSLWDISRRDTFTPAWMLHFGIPLGTHPAHPVYFLGEGRLFFDHIDDVSNNYQFWGGIRVHSSAESISDCSAV